MKTYKRQNIVQKELLSLVRIFKHDKEEISKLNNKGIGIYSPKINRAKVCVIAVGVIGLMITPFTNFLIVPLLKWGIK